MEKLSFCNKWQLLLLDYIKMTKWDLSLCLHITRVGFYNMRTWAIDWYCLEAVLSSVKWVYHPHVLWIDQHHNNWSLHVDRYCIFFVSILENTFVASPLKHWKLVSGKVWTSLLILLVVHSEKWLPMQKFPTSSGVGVMRDMVKYCVCKKQGVEGEEGSWPQLEGESGWLLLEARPASGTDVAEENLLELKLKWNDLNIFKSSKGQAKSCKLGTQCIYPEVLILGMICPKRNRNWNWHGYWSILTSHNSPNGQGTVSIKIKWKKWIDMESERRWNTLKTKGTLSQNYVGCGWLPKSRRYFKTTSIMLDDMFLQTVLELSLNTQWYLPLNKIGKIWNWNSNWEFGNRTSCKKPNLKKCG